ncbi:TrkA family potassium uptake protein [Brachybacterium sp. p3-SID957]|uniref:potassium channel family protein n=1 Tax=Brachybacterium sp. p3-SID957 TaxID=2916049 RepID=UPI00223B0142|nr:TrkA family potassium uptake protein [Brachybacterium sp. p3-SID957]MCT1776847.1 TrkA family potassium uptake protein [Brachybacterium sp. p3-SID957]
MHFVIMGCGRVGAMLAASLVDRGHTVAVIDQDPAAFARLGRDFAGERVAGLGFDRTTLERAHIREAAGFAAVSSGDNSNIIAARVVREEFGVRRVVARIYDPHRAEVYERLGIATVPTVRWAAAQVMGRLLPGTPERQYRDVSGALTMIALQPHPSWIGTPLSHVERETGSRVAHLTRFGEGVLPGVDAHVQDGDRLHLLVPTGQLERVETQLAHQRDEDEVRESYDRALRGERE